MSLPAVAVPGAQPERTGLAWRRTGVALLVGSLIALRVLPASAPSVWAFAPGVAGVVLAVTMLVAAEVRYRRVRRTLAAGGAGVGDGRLVAVTAAGTLLVGLLAVGLLVAGRV